MPLGFGREVHMYKRPKGNHRHLTYSDRCYIEQALISKSSFSAIATYLEKDPSTISKEIRRHSTPSDSFEHTSLNSCLHRHKCHIHGLCMACNTPSRRCAFCKIADCTKYCKHYESSNCDLLEKPPYVCNGCKDKNKCHKRKCYYRAKQAQSKYEKTLSESRKGINMTESELNELNEIVSPLIKKGQPLSHIYLIHNDEIPCSQRTVYNYIDQGLLDAKNLDLPRRVRFKKRKRKNRPSNLQQEYREKRTYKDFEKYTEAFPEYEVVELDTVKGSRNAGKCLMTLLFRKSNFMLVFLLQRCTQECVIKCFDHLYDTLGPRLFKKTFPIILTDNGPEFKNPWRLEKDINGKRRTKVFYCDPYLSNQKGKLEKNHEFIRYIIPKGRSMYFLNDELVRKLTCHINSVARKSLNGNTPFDLAALLLNKKVLASLKLQKVPSDEVILKPALLK